MSDQPEIIDVKTEFPRTIILQGDPGCGKSVMAGLTAVNKPVHFTDIDMKIKAAGWAQKALKEGKITVWELNEAIDDSDFVQRITGLVEKGAPTVAPKGWRNFGKYMNELPTTREGRQAGTWVIDSATLLNEHLKTHIMYLAKRSKFEFDQWTALKVGWMDTLSIIRKKANQNGKDLIITVHERLKEEPGDRTTGMKTETVMSVGGSLSEKKTYTGTQDIKVWASIDGSFGDLIGVHADEYYLLYVKIVDGKPVWKCRVQPDGRRPLRTSFLNREVEYDPDFSKIWK